MNLLSQASTASAVLSIVLAVLVLRLDSRALLNRLVAALALCVSTWSLGAASVFSASTDASFWLALRIAFTGFILVTPVGLAVVLVLVRLPRWWKVVLLVPAFGVAFAELWANWSGTWIMSGYLGSDWGNVLVYDYETYWGPIHSRYTEAGFFISLAVLGWSASRTRSRRLRAILVQYLVFEIAGNAAATWCIAVVWDQWGYPDPSVLVGGLYMPFYLVLITRYHHLVTDRPDLGASLFQSVQDFLFVARSDGSVESVSGAVVEALGTSVESLKGSPVARLLEGFPQLGAFDTLIQGAAQVPREVEGTWLGHPARAVITPIHDRFRDLDGVVIRLHLPSQGPALVQKYGVSSRELEIATLASEGLNTAEIAEALFIAPTTVKNHLASLYRKTGASNRVELARFLSAPSP